MNAEINKLMKAPALAETLESHGLVPAFDTPEQFAAALRRDREYWADFIRRTGLSPD
jgi:tripartite-type tricarboxylate transporter receptor subunit TctC